MPRPPSQDIKETEPVGRPEPWRAGQRALTVGRRQGDCSSLSALCEPERETEAEAVTMSTGQNTHTSILCLAWVM